MLMRTLLTFAFSGDLTVERLVTLMRYEIAPRFVPLMFAGIALVVLSVSAQLGTTKLGISLEKLIPDIKRLNPLKKLTSLPSQNLPIFLQALLLLPLVGAVVYYEAAENLDSFLELPWMGAQPAIARIGSVIETLLWRAVDAFSSGRNLRPRMAAQPVHEAAQDEQARSEAGRQKSSRAARTSSRKSGACSATWRGAI